MRDADEVYALMDEVPMQELMIRLKASVRTTLSARIAHILKEQSREACVGLEKAMCLVAWDPSLFETLIDELVRNTAQVIPTIVGDCLAPECDNV